jgi:hypothetical protein
MAKGLGFFCSIFTGPIKISPNGTETVSAIRSSLCYYLCGLGRGQTKGVCRFTSTCYYVAHADFLRERVLLENTEPSVKGKTNYSEKKVKQSESNTALRLLVFRLILSCTLRMRILNRLHSYKLLYKVLNY